TNRESDFSSRSGSQYSMSLKGVSYSAILPLLRRFLRLAQHFTQISYHWLELRPHLGRYHDRMRAAPDLRIIRGPGAEVLTYRKKTPDGGAAVVPKHKREIFDREPEMALSHINAAPQINSSVDRILGCLAFPFREFEEIIEFHQTIPLL